MAEEKASIIIPSRNEGLRLANTIDSIRRTAEWPNYEVIIVDDASQDGSTDRLEEAFPDVDLTIQRVGLRDTHGTAACRNRGLAVVQERNGPAKPDSDVLITLDAHEVMQNGWLRKFMELHREHPEAFLLAVSTGMRAVADLHVEDAVGISPDQLRDKISELRTRFGKPVIVEKSREPIDEKQPDRLEKLKCEYGVTMFYLDGPTTDTPAYRFRVKDSILAEDIADPGYHYGCKIVLDPDTQFLSPTWWKAADKDHPPLREIMPVDGFMGATYLFPRKLFEDRLGGWPPLAGWVHEEPWLSIAAGLQGIPILLHTGVVIAHDYDMPRFTPPNTKNIERAKLWTLHACFDDMLSKIQQVIFKGEAGELYLQQFEPELSRRRAMVQAGRVMSDREWLYRLGLLQYFDDVERESALRRLGGYGADSTKATADDVDAYLRGLSNNPDLIMGFAYTEMHVSAGTKQQTRFCEANVWDEQAGMRMKDTAEVSTLQELLGVLGIEILGRMAERFLRIASPWAALPELIIKDSARDAQIEAIQGFLGAIVEPRLNGIAAKVQEIEIGRRAFLNWAKQTETFAQADSEEMPSLDALLEQAKAEADAEIAELVKKAEEQQKAAQGEQPMPTDAEIDEIIEKGEATEEGEASEQP